MGNIIKKRPCPNPIIISSLDRKLHTSSVESISSSTDSNKAPVPEENSDTSDVDVSWHQNISNVREYAINWLTYDTKISKDLVDDVMVILDILKTDDTAFEEFNKGVPEGSELIFSRLQHLNVYFGQPRFHFKLLKQRVEYHYMLFILFHQRLIHAFRNNTSNCKGCELLDLLVISHALRGINFNHMQKFFALFGNVLLNLGLLTEANVLHVKLYLAILLDWIQERYENIYKINVREKAKYSTSVARSNVKTQNKAIRYRNYNKLKKWKIFADEINDEIWKERLLSILKPSFSTFSIKN